MTQPPREELELRVREASALVEVVVGRIARRLAPHVSISDLRAHAHASLLEVARSYDASRGEFRTWASMKLRWAIFDGLRRELRGRPAARARALASSDQYVTDATKLLLEDPPTSEEAHDAGLRRLLAGQAAALGATLVAGASDADTPESAVIREQRVAVLRRAVDSLPARERTLVERHYFGGEQFDSIAHDLGISKSWASRLHAQALIALARAMGEG